MFVFCSGTGICVLLSSRQPEINIRLTVNNSVIISFLVDVFMVFPQILIYVYSNVVEYIELGN